MPRYFFTLLLLLCCRLLFAQPAEVKRSGDIITIRGESYYLHVVDAGQSLYAIGKAYGVDVETILKINRKETSALSMFEVLKIPYVAPYVERDDTYYYHVAQKGETIYSLSRQYGIKPKRILQENRQYEEKPLAVGSIVRLPLAEMRKEERRAIVEAEIRTSEPQAVPPVVEPKIDRSLEMAEDSNQLPVGEVKVAILLPLHAQNTLRNNTRPDLDDTLQTWRYTPGIVPKWEGFLYFYEGLLLAADSLKRAGFRMELYTYDTEYFSDGISSKMPALAEELNRVNPDLIIGPVYASEFRMLEEKLENKQIPVVYPLSARTEGFGKHPNFIQVNTAAGSVAEQVARWISGYPEAHVVSFHFFGDEYREEAAMTRLTEQKMRIQDSLALPGHIPGRFCKWSVDGASLDSLGGCLDPNRENILLIPTAKEAEVSKLLPVLSSFAGTYRMTVIGLPDWQNFTSVDFETFYKLNVTFFSYSFINNFSNEAKAFSTRYREWFGTEPQTLSNKAFDIGLYFIPLAARFKGNTLAAIGSSPRESLFSSFRFGRFNAESGWENRGLLMIRYASDYTLRIERMK
ncbi:MAG: LysM peptidoglycan-binding domain-containing protein [Culturomica sp.]|jgi:LysM repeat protein|nr:LysM peptidoglycan-binding domain-containing protein [Culturomica sp.]